MSLARFPGQRRFTQGRLAATLRAAGFEVSRLELLPGLLPIAHVTAHRP